MMTGWLMGALLVAVAQAGAGAGVDTTRALTVEEAVASALSTHPLVSGARSRLGAAEAEAGQARAERLPTVAVAATAWRYEEPMVVAPIHGFTPQALPAFDETLYQAHASAEYRLFDGGGRGARIRAAEARATAADAGVEAARDQVIAEVVSTYLAGLTAREVRAAHGRQVEALEAERERVRLMLREGAAPRVAVLRSEAALSEARAGLEAADERLRLALRRLIRVSGLAPERVDAEALVEVALPTEPVPSRDRLIEAAERSNPRLREAAARVAAAERAVRSARAAFLPTLDLTGRYSAFGAPSTDPALEWQAGVQVSYPLFTGGARSRGVERVEALAAAARAEAASAERGVADAVDASLLAYRSARARVAALAAAVEQSAEVARIEALALEEGAGVQTDYLQAEAALLRARAGLAEARHAVVDARVRLAQATGRLNADWLAGLMEGVEQ